jgi:hypothetical protein
VQSLTVGGDFECRFVPVHGEEIIARSGRGGTR